MTDLLSFWKQALAAEVGIAIKTPDRQLLRQHLYRTRVEAKLPELEEIVILFPEKEDELWLVKRHADSQ